MKLNFLGYGSAYYPELGNTSAWFMSEKVFFLFDCGETVFRALRAGNVLDGISRAVVLITHMHADHCGSLPTLISYLRHRQGADVTVVHPDGGRIRALLGACGAKEDSYTLISGDQPVTIGAIRVEPCEVRHAANMRCYGYLVQDADEAFFYSGDAAEVPERMLGRFLSGGIQRMYIDCCVGPGGNHGDLAGHMAQVAPALRGNVCCMHVSPADIEAIGRAGFSLAGQEGK